MAAEIVRLVWCDMCLAADGSKVRAGDETVIVVGNSSTVLALCEPHAMEILAPLTSVLHLGDTKHEALQRIAAKPAKAPGPIAAADGDTPRSLAARRGGDVSCPRCDYTGPSRGAANHHTTRAHGLTLVEAEGLSVPTDAELTCSLCRKVLKGSAGFARHLTKTHGMLPDQAAEARRAVLVAWREAHLDAGQLALPGGP